MAEQVPRGPRPAAVPALVQEALDVPQVHAQQAVDVQHVDVEPQQVDIQQVAQGQCPQRQPAVEAADAPLAAQAVEV